MFILLSWILDGVYVLSARYAHYGKYSPIWQINVLEGSCAMNLVLFLETYFSMKRKRTNSNLKAVL